MERVYVGIIYTIKQKGYSYDPIRKFMHKYTDTPVEYYTDSIIDHLVETSLIAAVHDNEHPASILIDYFSWKHEPWNYSEFEAMCAALSNIQVRRENYNTGKLEYINGFCEMEDFND